ncbi:MAG: M4 family metallopeptidase [Bacteroidia bacterium]|nr:M4 family metallopeptidase [Bacteroidia bacterium]
MKRMLKQSFFALALIFCANVQAQDITINPFLNTPSRVVFKDQGPSYSNYSLVLRKFLKHSESTTWEPIRTIKDKIGQSHLRLQQFYRGVKVSTGIYIIHTKENAILSINGTFVPEDLLQGKQEIDSEEAIEKMLISFPSETYYWQDESMNHFLQELTKVEDTNYYPNPTMAFCSPNFDLSMPHRLCFVADVFSQTPLFGEKVYIDAETGELIANESQILDGNVTGKTVTKYSDTQTMVTDSVGVGNYRLRETVHGNGIETYNMRKGRSYGAAVDFTDADNFWNNANTNQDEVAGDAHWGAGITYDYFFNRFNRNSFDDKGTKIRSYVHYSSNYYNAFWSTGCNCMTYGDGNGGNPFPLTCLDVVAHEITHAVTTNTAALIYRNESGALNESFSDIFGNTVEAYGKPKGWSWAIGEEISSSGKGFRNMANPNLRNHPKYYHGVRWYFGTGDNGGVHLNSGVQNYWYYLLAHGSSGTNEKGDAFSIDSLGLETAADIAYRNLSVYLTRSSNYSEARTYSIASAVDLFGSCSKEVIMVTNAWWVCGIGDKYDSSEVKANFVADTFACHPSQAFTFKNTSTNSAKNEWFFGDGDTSQKRNPQHTYSSYGDFTVKLRATSCFKNKKDSITRTSYIKIDSTFDICNAAIMPRSGTDSVERCAGFVYDNGGESDYIALVQSNLKVTAPNADSIRLKFLYLDYELNYDSMVLFGKNTTQAEKIGQYTGNTTPNGGNWMTIPGDVFWVKHYSDPFVEGAGFKIEFESYHRSFSSELIQDTTLCSGDSLILSPLKKGGSQSGFYHTWSDGSHADTLRIQPMKDALVWVETIDVCTKESFRDSLNIYVRDPLHISVDKDSLLFCINKPTRLGTISSGGDSLNYRYSWTSSGNTNSYEDIILQDTILVKVTLTDGCTANPAMDSVLIYTYPSLAYAKPLDTILCRGTSLNIDVVPSGGIGSGYTLNWDHGKTGIITETPVQNEVYYFTLSDGCSPDVSDSISVDLYDAIEINALKDTILCDGQELLLGSNARGGKASSLAIRWLPGNLIGNSQRFNLPNGSIITAIAEDGCTVKSDTTTLLLSKRAPLQATISSNPGAICINQASVLTLSQSGGITAQRKQYLNGVIEPQTSVTVNPTFIGDTRYVILVDDGCSTPAKDSLDLRVHDLPQASLSLSAREICEDETVTLSYSSAQTITDFWWKTTGLDSFKSVSNNQIINAPKPNKYIIRASFTDANGCRNVAGMTDTLIVYAKPSASFSVNPIITNIENNRVNFTNTQSGSLTWLWLFGDGESEINTNAPSHLYGDTGTYTSTLICSSLPGCNDTAMATIRINDVYRLWLPNTFSPNEDGVNDKFIIRGRGIKSIKMTIYDRWGSQIFETLDMNAGWDAGKYPNGQYIVILEIHDVLGEIHHEKGVVSITR